jgi:hypothetical protein
VLLKFDVLNETRSRLADVVMRVSFIERDTHEIDASPARVLVGPFTIRVHETLPAGYVLSYELLFQKSFARVRVLASCGDSLCAHAS